MTAQEKLKEVVAEEELNARGYFKVNCPVCIGGLVKSEFVPLIGHILVKCAHCNGDRTIWEKRQNPVSPEVL